MSPDRSAEAIDLTLDLTSDSDDDAQPICLSSSPATPLRSASIELIGEIFSSGRLSQAQSRPPRNGSRSPPVEASTLASTQNDPHDTFSTALAKTPVEHVYEELNVGTTSPTRPRPRRRKRPIIEDEQVVQTIPFDKRFQQPFSPLSPEPYTPNTEEVFRKEDDTLARVCSPMRTDDGDHTIQMECDEDTLVLSSPSALKQVDGGSEWADGPELEDMNEASIYLPSHHASPALQVNSEEVPSDAFSRFMSRMEQPVPSTMEWQDLDELLHDNSGLAISLPLGEEAMQLNVIPEAIEADGTSSRAVSISDEADSRAVRETVAAALESRSRSPSQSSSQLYSYDTSQSNARSVSPPIASRIGLRNRKQRVAASEASDQREPSYPMCSPSTPIPTERRESMMRASLSSATSNSFSILSAAPRRPFERPSGRRRGGVSARVRATMFEDGSSDLPTSPRESRSDQDIHVLDEQRVEKKLPRQPQEVLSRERTNPPETEDDWCILPDFRTPTARKIQSGSQQSTVESPGISPRNRRKDSTTTENVESPNSVRRGTRVRKATDKKEYVPLSHIFKKSCRKPLEEPAVRPTTPNAEAGPSGWHPSPLSQPSLIAVKSPSHAVPRHGGKSLSRILSSLAEKLPSLATPSFAVKSPSLAKSTKSDVSLGSLAVSPRRRREAPQACESELKGSLNARSLRRNNTSLPETPTSAVSIVTSPRIRLNVLAPQQQCQIIPFPPNRTGAEPNEYLTASDLQDILLMAACGALHDGSNKAMSAADIAEVCVKYDWPQGAPTITSSVISNAIRNYQRRVANGSALGRKSLLGKHTLQGHVTEAYLMPGVHPDVVTRHNALHGPKGVFWYLEGEYGSSRWESPFAKLKQTEEAERDLPAGQPKQQMRKVPIAPPFDISKQVMPEAATKSRPKLRPRSDRDASRSSKAASLSDEEASASFREVVPSAESDSDEQQDESSDADSSADDCRGDESAFAFYSNFDSFSESDDNAFHTETDSEFDTEEQRGRISPKRSPTLLDPSAIAGADMHKREDEILAVPHAIGSAGSDITLFPNNPLGPVQWEQGTRTTSYTFPFDDTPASDASHHSKDDDVVMEDVASDSAETVGTEGVPNYRLSWKEQQALFAEPPELVEEDFDTIATTPVSSTDSALLADLPYQRDLSVTSDRETSAEPVRDLKEVTDQSLANVVRMLGGLLPVNVGAPDATKDDAVLHGPRYTTTHIRTKPRAPRFFVRSREPSSIPLGLPTLGGASPPSSPNSTSSRAESWKNPSLLTPPCDAASVDTGATSMSIHELDFLSDLQSQMSYIDIDPEELSLFEDRNGSDSPPTRHLHNAKDFEIKQDGPHLGPESVGMSELDDLLGESTGVLFAATGPSLASCVPIGSDNRTSPIETSGTLIPNTHAKRSGITRDGVDVEGRNNTHLPSESRPDVDMPMITVEEDDQIGIKEVDDAMLYSWAEEGRFMAIDEADDSSPLTDPFSESIATTRGSSMETDFEVKSMSADDPFEAVPMSVDPSVLTIVRPPDLFSASKLPDAPLLGRSFASRLPTAWNDDPKLPQGSKAVPRFAIRPRAMVKCTPITRKAASVTAPPKSASLPPASRKSKRVESRTAEIENQARKSVTPASTGATAPRDAAAASHQDVTASEGSSVSVTHSEISPDGASAAPPVADVDQNISQATPAVNKEFRPPTVTHKPVDNVFVFVVSWGNASVYRRIDTNYINVSSLCRALKLEDRESEFRGLPRATLVQGFSQPEANGLWLHLSLVAMQAKTLPIPDELASVLLNPNLIQDFSTYAKFFARAGKFKVQALPAFGMPFGWRRPPDPSSVTGQQGSRKESPAASTAITAPSQPGTLAPQPLAETRKTVEQKPPASQQLAVTPVKRPSPTATSYQVISERPLTKRLRPLDSHRSIISMASMTPTNGQAVSTT